MPAQLLVVFPTGHQVYNLIHPFEQVFECCCDPCYHCSIVKWSIQRIFFPSIVVLQLSLKSLIDQSLCCPMSTVTSLTQSSFSLLSVKWLLCIQPVNLPNVSLSRFSSSMSGWLTPCLTSQVFLAGIFHCSVVLKSDQRWDLCIVYHE
jgi:hypothetical protein